MSATGMRVIGLGGNYFGRVVHHGVFAGITLAETRYSIETIVSEHRHQFPGFFLALRGRFETRIGTRWSELLPGRASYHHPEDVHALRVLSPSASGLNVEVADAGTEILSAFERGISSTGHRISPILAQLHLELRKPDTASLLAVQGLTLQVIAELARGRQERLSQPPKWVRQIEQFLCDHASDRLDMSKLSEIAGVEPRRIPKVFKAFLHCTPAEFLRKRRLLMAQERLANSEEPLSQVATQAGFYDQADFCRQFKRATGYTPGKYRRLVR